MALVDKLQALKAKLYTKFGKQEGPLVFRKQTRLEGDIGAPYSSNATNTDVTIESGAKVGRVRRMNLGPSTTVQVGDLIVEVPGHLLTEAQLKGSVLVYLEETYTLVNYDPPTIINEEPLSWMIIARRKAG